MGKLIVKSHPDYKPSKTQEPPTIKLKMEYNRKLFKVSMALVISIIANIIFLVKLYAR